MTRLGEMAGQDGVRGYGRGRLGLGGHTSLIIELLQDLADDLADAL